MEKQSFEKMGVYNSIKMRCAVSETYQGIHLTEGCGLYWFSPPNTEVSKTSLNISKVFIHLLVCSEYRQAMQAEKVWLDIRFLYVPLNLC